MSGFCGCLRRTGWLTSPRWTGHWRGRESPRAGGGKDGEVVPEDDRGTSIGSRGAFVLRVVRGLEDVSLKQTTDGNSTFFVFPPRSLQGACRLLVPKDTSSPSSSPSVPVTAPAAAATPAPVLAPAPAVSPLPPPSPPKEQREESPRVRVRSPLGLSGVHVGVF